MIRTTVRLPAELLSSAQRLARETGRTFTELLEDAVRHELQRRTSPRAVREPLPTYGGRGLHSGVDLADNAALDDIMRGS